MKDWNDLKLSYRGTLRMLQKKGKQLECDLEKAIALNVDLDSIMKDIDFIKDMITDVNLAINWLHTGKMPGSKRGIERRSAYQKNKLMDPLRMQAFSNQYNSRSASTLTDWQRYQLEDALSRLSPQQRECYELAHGGCYPYAEIAIMLGISKGTVQGYVERAQKKVTEDLNSSLFLI
ncbi:sigma-70 family RNA polymerase sigma factor [Paenibacillus psychroresistens]|uniref:Sigma-70 family RNA polymerase sigma factor n=2 Tax=Paenibacillus psychroresistens TaxID=1778678 RepID=A0A6B8RX95_9BACL|nr:sigma-70 family RNA polymerase sigma factor [Paenibacillus psychroresistens]